MLFSSGAAALASPTDSLQPLLDQARHLVTCRQNAKAEQLYRTALRLDPANSAAHAGLGWALFDQGKRPSGFAEEKRAIQLNPQNALAHHYLASMLLTGGKMQGAAAEYRIEYKIDPKRRCHCGPIERLLKQYPSSNTKRRHK